MGGRHASHATGRGDAIMTEHDLLTRVAATLKREVGPSVILEYPKTQAFMASVVLDKLNRQLERAAAHQSARERDCQKLLAALSQASATQLPAAVTDALAVIERSCDDAALSDAIKTLYAHKTELGLPVFDALLGSIRKFLRADLERRLEIAR